MHFVHKVIRAIFPTSWSAAMEAESRRWRLDCPCGYATSIWEMGGVRYGGKGNPWRRGRCAECGQSISGYLYKVRDDEEPGKDRGT